MLGLAASRTEGVERGTEANSGLLTTRGWAWSLGLPYGLLWGHAPGMAGGGLRAQLTPAPPSPPPKCVVIGLQSTGEARTREVLDEKDGQLDCFVSAAE